MKKKVIELLLQRNNKLARQHNDFIFDLRRGLMQCGSFGDCRVRNGKKYRNMVTFNVVYFDMAHRRKSGLQNG